MKGPCRGRYFTLNGIGDYDTLTANLRAASRPGWTGKRDVMRLITAKFMTVPRVIIGALILFSIALNFANVIGRYVFFSSIIWAEEVMIFIMVWCVFIGAILVSYDCLLYTSPSPRDRTRSRMPSSA